MTVCKYCHKPPEMAKHYYNNHQVCMDYWDQLIAEDRCGKCGEKFNNDSDRDCKVHDACYPDSVPYSVYGHLVN